MFEKLHNHQVVPGAPQSCDDISREYAEHYICICVSGQELLIPVSYVEQVASAATISLFPGATPYLRGLFVSRGDEITPVVNLAALLGFTGNAAESVNCCVVVSWCGERFALLVEAVTALRSYQSTHIESSHCDFFSDGTLIVSGAIKDAESVFPIIDVKAIFQTVFSRESGDELMA